MPIVLNGSTGITTPTYNGSTTAEYLVPVTGFKNRLINGDMGIDQRNAGASVTPTADIYTLDRWQAVLSQSSKYSVQQNAGSVTPPAGFTNYLGATSTSSYSVGAGDYFTLQQNIEGFNIADLDFGKATAKTITLSFWVRSSLTGTFGGTIANSAQSRCYPFTYTISVANTWEQKSVTIAGDTTGTWVTNNGIGIRLNFGLGVGSTYSGTAGAWSSSVLLSATGATSVVGTNGATFYITGVQLEVGSNATSFDYLPYGTELALCQRYAHKISADGTALYARLATGFCDGSNTSNLMYYLPVSMRTAPSLTTTGTAGNYAINSGTSGLFVCSSVPSIQANGSTTSVAAMQAISSGMTGGQGALLLSNNNASAFLLFTAEL